MVSGDRDWFESTCLNCGYQFTQKTASYDIKKRFAQVENKYEYQEDRTVRKARESKRIKDPRKPKKDTSGWSGVYYTTTPRGGNLWH